MAIPEFHFETCAHCGREITADQRSRTGWSHVLDGVRCPPTYAVPYLEVKQ